MTAPKTKYPVSSFGPELMAFLTRSGRERVVLTFHSQQIEGEWDGSGKRAAHNFQRRIHTLRSKMREEKHELYPFAARARISIFWGPNAVAQGGPEDWARDHKGDRGAIIVGRPHDTEFSDVLKSAGITPDDTKLVSQPALPSPAPEQGLVTDEAAPAADWLDEIWPEHKDKSS